MSRDMSQSIGKAPDTRARDIMFDDVMGGESLYIGAHGVSDCRIARSRVVFLFSRLFLFLYRFPIVMDSRWYI